MTSFDTSRLPVLDATGRARLFTYVRTANSFSDEPVTDDELRDIWELARWAPTSANVQPLRVVYVRTPEGKARLLPHLYDTNRPKSEAAPVVAVLAADLAFHELIHKTFPIRPEMKERFNDEAVRTEAALYNATLQAGYFILAVRAAGLAAGPMLGFDKAGIDAEFFAGTTLVSTLVVNIGHPGENPWFPRLPRLELDEIITWA